MKYIVILGDGMADRPVAMLNNKTPLELANKPNIDYLATHGECGMVQTIPEGMKPGSDVANLSVMGYDPTQFYTGRSPIEALSMGIKMSDTDVAFRCNLVTLTDEEQIYENKTILDYSAGEITTDEAKELIDAVQSALGTEQFDFHSGVSYRHCLISHKGEVIDSLTPPHDITDKAIFEYLPKDSALLELMKKSYDILSTHPINVKRVQDGKRPANSIWLWGAGKKLSLPTFKSLYNLNGGVISAVDLLKGIGIAGDMKVINVEGATGRLDTNFKGKADACLEALNSGCDYIYLHVEAPDECGHQGAIKDKVKAIELIDSEIVGYLMEKLTGQDYSLLICPDHATPLELKTHSSEAVPYIIYRSNVKAQGVDSYTEKNCEATERRYSSGVELGKAFTQYDSSSRSISDPTFIAPDMDSHKENGDFILPEVEVVVENIPVEDESIPEVITTEQDNTTLDDTATADDTNKKKSKEKSTADKPKKAGTPMDAKKKKIMAIVIACVIFAIIVTASIVTPILIINKDKIFVSNAEDFGNVDKGNYYVLNKDITVDSDLNISNPYSIDLNGHNLVVNGILSFTHNQNDQTLYLGTKKGKEYIKGGSITAKELKIDCTGKLVNHAVISTDSLRISVPQSDHHNNVAVTNSLYIVGGKHNFNNTLSFAEGAATTLLNTEVSVAQDGKSDYNLANSQIVLQNATTPNSVTLDQDSTARIFGKVKGNVTGGKSVVMGEGSGADIVSGMQELWVEQDNANINYINVPSENIYDIIKLAAPIDMSIERTPDGKIIATATKVNNAVRYAFYVNDKDPIFVIDDGTTAEIGTIRCDISEYAAAAGEHTVRVQALGAEGADTALIVPSPFIKAVYLHKVKLEAPKNVQVLSSNYGAADNVVTLNFDKVHFADEYLITINGTQIKHHPEDNNNITIDISQYVANVGAYSIRIQARSVKNAALDSSDVVLTSYESRKPHASITDLAIITLDDGTKTLQWTAVDTAKRYTIAIAKADGTVEEYKINGNYFVLDDLVATGDTITVTVDEYQYYSESASSNVVTV